MNKGILRIVFLFVALTNISDLTANTLDKNYTQMFSKAEEYFANENYTAALPLYIKLDSIDKGTNANTKFKIGFCYLNAPTYKTKSIPYFEDAIKKITSSYAMGDIKETKAPLSTYYYLAQAYHLNYDFDKAIETYQKYIETLGSDTDPKVKSEIDDVKHDIETCNNGKELIKKPKKAIITNLGAEINSAYADYSPLISLDEQTLVFTSRRIGGASDRKELNGMHFEDIYIAEYKDEKWQKAKLIGKNINGQGHEATVNLSADGLKLLIYKDDGGNGNLYLSQYKGDAWQSAEYVGAPVNSSAWETHACFSSDNRILYFVSDRSGGFGGRDIYKCLRLPNGEWGPPQNLGETINTKYDEDGVFIHPDGRQIYFSSKGHQSMGGFDIFTSYLDEENGFWTSPVNFGYPINTPDDEVFMVTTADGKRSFYSSDKEGGFGEKDIYMISYQELEPRDITILVGKIINYNNVDISNNMIYIINTKNNDTIQELEANPSTGKFGANLPVGTSYKTIYKINNEIVKEEVLDAPRGTRYNVIRREIPYGTPYDSLRIKDSLAVLAKMCSPQESSYQLNFAYNKKQIDTKSDEFVKFINALAKCIKNNPNLEIAIESSASTVPTSTFRTNENLANKRGEEAKSVVVKALVKLGFTETQLKFAKFDAKVQGPTYNKDAKENVSVYEQYQYIKVKAK